MVMMAKQPKQRSTMALMKARTGMRSFNASAAIRTRTLSRRSSLIAPLLKGFLMKEAISTLSKLKSSCKRP